MYDLELIIFSNVGKLQAKQPEHFGLNIILEKSFLVFVICISFYDHTHQFGLKEISNQHPL